MSIIEKCKIPLSNCSSILGISYNLTFSIDIYLNLDGFKFFLISNKIILCKLNEVSFNNIDASSSSFPLKLNLLNFLNYIYNIQYCVLFS